VTGWIPVPCTTIMPFSKSLVASEQIPNTPRPSAMTSTSSPSIIDRQLAHASVALCRGRKQSQA
jgi:hypothetical protein